MTVVADPAERHHDGARPGRAFWWLLVVTALLGSWTTTQVAGRLIEPSRTLAFVLTLTTSWGVLAAGVVGRRLRPESRMPLLLVLLGLGLFLEDVQVGRQPLWVHSLGLGLGLASVGPAAHVVLAYPGGRLGSRARRATVVAGYLTSFALGPLTRPTHSGGNQFVVRAYAEGAAEAYGYPGWVEAAYARFDRLDLLDLGDVAAGAVGVVVVGLVATRWIRLDPTARRLVTPVLATSLVATVAGVAMAVGAPSVAAVAGPLYRLAALASVAALLWGTLQAGVQVRTGRLAADLFAAPDLTSLRDLSRRALSAPDLDLALVSDEPGRFLTADGTAVGPQGPAGRRSVPVWYAGRLVGLLVQSAHRPTPDVGWTTAVLAGLAPALERLRAQAEAAQREARHAAVRAEAASARHQVERDLHDGVQSSLVAALVSMRQAEHAGSATASSGGGGADPALLGRAARALEQALADVRRISHGVRPAVLQETSLDVALGRLAAQTPLPVALRIEGDLADLGPDVIDLAYRVAVEGVTNALKHPSATALTLAVVRSEDAVQVEVVDDGTGGAHPVPGGGLAQLGDAVRAACGHLTATASRSGSGTRLTGWIPLPGKHDG